MWGALKSVKLSGFYPLLALRHKEDQAGSKAGWETGQPLSERAERLVVGFLLFS